MTNLKALIFDVDGTLANTEKNGHRVAFNHAFAIAGLDWEWTVSLYGDLLAVSGGKERIRHYLNEYKPDFVAPGDVDQFIRDLHQKKSEYFQSLLAEEGIALRPGVKRLLKEAHQADIRLVIATTTAYDNVVTLLSNSLAPDAPDWFELIAAGDIVPAKKPAPDIYQYVLQQMNLSASDCLAFEDTEHGLRAATQTGIPTVVTVNDYTKEQDFSEAVLVLDHFGEPEQPFTVLAGDAKNRSYFDLNLAEKLLTSESKN